MPLYEYHCRDCDDDVELLIRGDAQQPECPSCGGAELVKLLSVPATPVADGAAPDREPPTGPCGSACGCFPE
ncbi:MAG: zinc ribbon domain-containing protein [Planctomycetota bacterium]